VDEREMKKGIIKVQNDDYGACTERERKENKKNNEKC
jgi:hypothetical protein